VGGLPEVVREDETGALATLGDVEAMANYATQLFDDAKLRRSMGARAREIAINEFTTDRIIPQYVQLYERVVNK
jgi:L-malate glycosyltransferase